MNMDPFVQIILDRMDEHREQSGTRHKALFDAQRDTNQKLDTIVSELAGGNVRFERIEADIRAIALRTQTLEEASENLKNNALEIIKAVVVPALLSLCSAAAGVFGTIKWMAPALPASTTQAAP